MNITSPPHSITSPPQSPLFILGEDKLRKQLDLEERLQIVGEELLEGYKDTRQWKQVGQIAQTLTSNSERVSVIKQCLHQLDLCPISYQDTETDSVTMVDKNRRTCQVTVEVIEQTCDDDACWSIKSQDVLNKPVLRTLKDVSLLRAHLCKHHHIQIPLSNEDSLTSDALQELLLSALEEVNSQSDPLLLSFLSSKVDNFAVIAKAENTTLQEDQDIYQKHTLNTNNKEEEMNGCDDVTSEDRNTYITQNGDESVNQIGNVDTLHVTREDESTTDTNESGIVVGEEEEEEVVDRSRDKKDQSVDSPDEVTNDSNNVSTPAIFTSPNPSSSVSPTLTKSFTETTDDVNSLTSVAKSVYNSTMTEQPQNSVIPLNTEVKEKMDSEDIVENIQRRDKVEVEIEKKSSEDNDVPEKGVVNDSGMQERDELEKTENDEMVPISEKKVDDSSTFFLTSDHTKITSESPKRQKSFTFIDGSSSRPDPVNKFSRIKNSFKKTKIKKEVSLDTGAVSLMAPRLATDWDPTCLLEELYQDHRPIVSHSTTGENSRHSGYLDKLPVNQRKPQVMKGWKHRYFRLTRGSLFYYEDEKSTRAISFIRLTDSKIVLHSESLKIEIVEKGSGNLILLRADSKEDATAWHRVLQLESVHPTMTHRPSLSPTRSSNTIILDLGSCSIRAGLVNDNDYPQVFFPNVCSKSEGGVIACGSESLLPHIRGQARLVYPFRHRIRMDTSISVRDCFHAIIETVCKSLHAEPEKFNILVSISPVLPTNTQQIVAEVLLETFGFQGILLQEQTTMALYSYNCTTGISVNIGDTIDVVPIIDGYKVEGGSFHLPLAGNAISENLSKLATTRDIRYFSEPEMYIIRHVKENLCFLSQDYAEDMQRCEETPSLYTRAVDVDRFQLPNHRKVIALDTALFKAPEGLFLPPLWGKDVPGVHEMIHKSIEQCPLDMRKTLARHIYLSGGTSLLIGFPERLQKELLQLMPRLEVVVHAKEDRYHAAYLGASILASLSSFQTSLVKLDNWISQGLDAFKTGAT